MTSIQVVPYDPHWPHLFESASAEVATAMADCLVAIHHIGSTSIPGMSAKRVIDILAVVREITAVDSRAPAMEAIGYEAMGEFGIPGRRYFRRDGAAGRRTHQVHAFAVDSPHVERHLAFRDFLRVHPKFARQYAELKLALAAAHPHDMNAYMDGKDGFIKDVEARAVEWSRRKITE